MEVLCVGQVKPSIAQPQTVTAYNNNASGYYIFRLGFFWWIL